jgi:hypothetical protein
LVARAQTPCRWISTKNGSWNCEEGGPEADLSFPAEPEANLRLTVKGGPIVKDTH